MRVFFDHRVRLHASIYTFWFRPEKPLRFVAGQFIELYLPHASVDGRGERRWFTISSAPTDRLVSITTKLAAQDGSSFKQALMALSPGAEVTMAEPFGDFVLPKDATIPLVFIAGGIGITPMHSMVRWLQAVGEQRPIQLIHAVTDANNLIFSDVFSKYGMAFVPVVEQPPTSWYGEVGLLSGERILRLASPSPRTLFYISGPESMATVLAQELRAAGIEPERIVTDYFPGYGSL